MRGETAKIKNGRKSGEIELKVGIQQAYSIAAAVYHDIRGHLQLVLCGRLTFRQACY